MQNFVTEGTRKGQSLYTHAYNFYEKSFFRVAVHAYLPSSWLCGLSIARQLLNYCNRLI